MIVVGSSIAAEVCFRHEFSKKSKFLVSLPERKGFQPVTLSSSRSRSRSFAVKAAKYISPYIKYKTVLSEAMCNETLKIMDSKESRKVKLKDLIEGIKMASGTVTEYLSSRARIICNSEEIAQVATTWTDGDKKIGKIIAKALEIIGTKEGHIFFSSQEWKSSCVKLLFCSGLKLDWGYISPSFVTNKTKSLCVFEFPRIFVFERKLLNIDVVMEILRMATRTPVLIVAEDFENDVLDTLITNKLTIGAKVCAIKAPGHAFMKDLRHLIGSKVITEEDCAKHIDPFGSVKIVPRLAVMAGSCTTAIVSEYDTILLRRGPTMDEIEEEISKELRLTSKSITADDQLYAVLKVGGPNSENVDKKLRILTHALVAAKAAMEEGVVPGAGIVFLNASKELDKLQTTTSAEMIAVQIIQNALKMPLYSIASTAGVEGSDVVGKLLNEDNIDLGYNASTGEFVDMIGYGIVEPLKLIRKAFVGATCVFLKKLCEGRLDEVKEGRRYCSKWALENEIGKIQGKPM